VDTSISRRINADPDTVFRLAAAVEDWPRILPHYRWVRVLVPASQHRRTVEMAARRDVVGRLGIPLRWTAIQTCEPSSRRIEFEHIRGVTRGMYVAWSIERESKNDDSALLVQIRHVFNPRWGVPDWLVQQIVGEYFVNGVARRTLRRIGEIAEATKDRTKDA
jgi:ribosome-associated toxin RatA of RatAB toxin-antitoxin module